MQNAPHQHRSTGPIRRRRAGRIILAWAIGLTFSGLLTSLGGASPSAPPASDAVWTRGPSVEAAFFPIAVWLQQPSKAAAFASAGINVYVGLWRGPTQEHLDQLRRAGMKLICRQSAASLKFADDPVIIGWMHNDEPDNAQSLGAGKGYGPPVSPQKVIADYEKIRATDPTRPVFLNLGQGVAWDQWIGRGVRRNHPEDYSEYVQGADILSFDIYPVAHSAPEVSGNLWFVARGVERLRGWSKPEQVVWNCLECTRIHEPGRKATPAQVRTEAWMSIIHGSRGLIYFVHEWAPEFDESALLHDPAMLAGVTALNREIQGLAPVVNSTNAVVVAAKTLPGEGSVALMARQHDGALYVFAVNMRNVEASATFALPEELAGKASEGVMVLGEQRELILAQGGFSDRFGPWAVRLYRVPMRGLGSVVDTER